jgi:hypothetical protein
MKNKGFIRHVIELFAQRVLVVGSWVHVFIAPSFQFSVRVAFLVLEIKNTNRISLESWLEQTKRSKTSS